LLRKDLSRTCQHRSPDISRNDSDHLINVAHTVLVLFRIGAGSSGLALPGGGIVVDLTPVLDRAPLVRAWITGWQGRSSNTGTRSRHSTRARGRHRASDFLWSEGNSSPILKKWSYPTSTKYETNQRGPVFIPLAFRSGSLPFWILIPSDLIRKRLPRPLILSILLGATAATATCRHLPPAVAGDSRPVQHVMDPANCVAPRPFQGTNRLRRRRARHGGAHDAGGVPPAGVGRRPSGGRSSGGVIGVAESLLLLQSCAEACERFGGKCSRAPGHKVLRPPKPPLARQTA